MAPIDDLNEDDLIMTGRHVFTIYDHPVHGDQEFTSAELERLLLTEIHPITGKMESSILFSNIKVEGELATVISCRDLDTNKVDAIMLCQLRHGCIQVLLFQISQSISQDSQFYVTQELIKLAFNHLAPDDRCLIACCIHNSWPSIRKFCVPSEEEHTETCQGDESLERLPFSVMTDTKDIKYCMSAINDFQEPYSDLPWLEHYDLETSEEQEDLEEEEEACDTYLKYAYIIGQEQTVIFLRIDTDRKQRVKYPPGFHPNNHWKKNKKKLYLPRPQQQFNDHSRGGRGGRGGRGRGRGGRGRGRGGGRGGGHGNGDDRRRYHRAGEDEGEESKIILLVSAIATVLIFAGTRLFKSSTD